MRELYLKKMNPTGSSTFKCLECHERFQTEWVCMEQVLCRGTHTPIGMYFLSPPAPRANQVRPFPTRQKRALNGRNGQNGRKRSEI